MPKIAAVFMLSLAAAMGGFARTVVASQLPPASYPAGATEFEILFVTSGTISPTSGQQSTYNAFVTSQANAAGSVVPSGLTWNAVVSTEVNLTIGVLHSIKYSNASSNAPSTAGIPIYNTAGQLITNLGLYSDNQLSSMPEYNQFGNVEQTAVVTGSNTTGTHDNPLGTNGAWNVGQSNSTSSGNWISSASESGANDEFAIYALSDPIPIHVQASPEPATLTLLGSGLLAYCGYRRLKKRGRKPAEPDDEIDHVA